MIFNSLKKVDLVKELKSNLLKPFEYEKLAKFLLENNQKTLSIQVTKTGLLSYPESKQLKELSDLLCINYQNTREVKKIFCIGLSRTGTNSISNALELLGYEGKHWNGELSEILDWHDIEKYDFVSDTAVACIFESLYYAYPDAYFIYTTREINSWVSSMENHFKWTNGFSRFKEIVDDKNRGGGNQSLIRRPQWGFIHKNLYTRHESWSESYKQFDTRVKKFFSSKANSNFLQIDVGLSDEKKWEWLCNFLGHSNIPLRMFPRKNIKLMHFSSKKCTIDAILDGDFNKNSHQFKTKNIDNFITKTKIINDKLQLTLPSNAEKYYAFSRSKCNRPNIDLIDLQNAVISIDRTKPYNIEYYIFTESGEYLKQISHGDSPFLNDIKKTDKEIFFVEDKFSQFNICHLLLDKLPRFSLNNKNNKLECFFFKKNKYTCDIAFLNNIQPLFLDDIDNRQKLTIQFKNVQLSSSSSYSFIHPGHNMSPYVTTFLKNTGNSIQSKKVLNRKIFIDRSNAKSRRIVNNNEVIDLLLDFGFEIIQPEKMPADEQIRIFKESCCVIGVHGAGLTNIAFCNEGTKILELMPPLCGTNAFWKLAQSLNLNYECMIVQDEGRMSVEDYSTWTHNPAAYNRNNVIVPIALLRKLLENMFS